MIKIFEKLENLFVAIAFAEEGAAYLIQAPLQDPDHAITPAVPQVAKS